MPDTARKGLRVLTLPGWLDSGPAHWQSRWEALAGFERVQQADWVWPRRGDWLARLDECLLADDRPAALVAHSLGCQLVATWAAHWRTPAASGLRCWSPCRTPSVPTCRPSWPDGDPSCATACPFPPMWSTAKTTPSARRNAPAQWRRPGVLQRPAWARAGISMRTVAWVTGPTA